MNFDASVPVTLFDDVEVVYNSVLTVRPIQWGLAEKSVMEYHYSKRMPRADDDYYGCWEQDGKYVGVVIFGSGANMSLGEPYGLGREQVCELLRVALGAHTLPVSQIVTEAIREVRKDRQKLRLIVSFADPEHGHHGGIYQAMNWIYTGMTTPADEYIVKGVRMHGRALRSTRSTSPHRDVEANNILEWTREVLDPDVERVDGSSKHRYLYPLDKAMRRQVSKLSLEYPRGLSVDGDTSSFHDGDAGSTPADRSMEKVS